MTSIAPEQLAAAVADHGVELVGRLMDASNAAFFAWAGPVPVIYKPVSGERPLWDFPTGCLAHRERASFLLDRAAGFEVVPPTVLHDGPLGAGTVQAWVTDPDALFDDAEPDSADVADLTQDPTDPDEDQDADEPGTPPLFALVPPGALRPPWLPVFTGELPDGRDVVLAHADSPELRSVSVLDAVLNNSDRKGSHLLRAPDGHLWGIDHGLCLHEEPKLRTVLWGWAGEPLRQEDLDRLVRLQAALEDPALVDELDRLLTVPEVEALSARVGRLVLTGRHPRPHPGWPSVPWPAL